MINLTLFANCHGRSRFAELFGMPSWHQYIEHEMVRARSAGGNICTPILGGVMDFWLIALAVVEILLRLAAIVAVFFVVYGGIKFAASRGNADKVESARSTLLDALIGLLIAITAIAIVAFIGRQFGG